MLKITSKVVRIKTDSYCCRSVDQAAATHGV